MIKSVLSVGTLLVPLVLAAGFATAAERYTLRIVDLKPGPLKALNPYWQFKLDAESRAILARLSEDNLDRQFIFRADPLEISRPWIHEPIRGEAFNLVGTELDRGALAPRHSAAHRRDRGGIS